jgi:hypothetical protein
MLAVRWVLPWEYYVVITVASAVIYATWWGLAWRCGTADVKVANRALVISLVGQSIYMVWHLTWRHLVGAEVTSDRLLTILSIGELIEVSLLALAVLYGGGEMLHYLYLRYQYGPRRAEDAFAAAMADLAVHPFRRLWVLVWLWLVFGLALSVYLFLPRYLSR